MHRQKILFAAAALLVGVGAAAWGVGAWIDAQIKRRVDAEVERRVQIAVQQLAAAAEDSASGASERQPTAATSGTNRQPESLEDYAARVEFAKRRLAIRGITDPSPSQISLELHDIESREWYNDFRSRSLTQ